MYYSLQDGITAGKQITGLPSALRNRHYSFQFSLSEKDAELFGNSIGAGAGLLAYTLILNRYYRAQVAGVGSSTAITGCIQQNERITPVDSLGLKGKLKAAFFSPLSRVVVPSDNMVEAVEQVNNLKKRYPNRFLIIDGTDSLSRAILDRNLVKQEKITVLRKSIGKISKVPNHYYLFALFGLMMILFLCSLNWEYMTLNRKVNQQILN